MAEDAYQLGLENRRRVMGDGYVTAQETMEDDLEADYRRFVTEYAWGATWGRDGLTDQQRSLITIAVLASLNRPHELAGHVRGALRNGCTEREITETFQHLCVYAGVPAAATAFRVARPVLRPGAVD